MHKLILTYGEDFLIFSSYFLLLEVFLEKFYPNMPKSFPFLNKKQFIKCWKSSHIKLQEYVTISWESDDDSIFESLGFKQFDLETWTKKIQ